MRFRYLADPLFIACVALYTLNRFALKPHLDIAFLHDHLNDVICLPFWIPIMLWLQRCCGLRADDAPPRPLEIAIPLIIWSIAFELWLPTTATFARWATPDPLDIVCYAAGGLAAVVFWRWWYGTTVHVRAPAVPDARAA